MERSLLKPPKPMPKANTEHATTLPKAGQPITKNDDTIYICNGDEWIEMSSTIGVPFATDTTPGKVQLTGEITGSL